MIVGIVGSEAAKFIAETEKKAKEAIYNILSQPEVTGMSSGACYLGGIDIWAEEIAKELKKETYIYSPIRETWEYYKRRNILIAEKSDIVYCITVAKLPDNYTGMRFNYCYHCNTKDHVKSGGCWTAKYAAKIGKLNGWVIV